MSLLLQALKGGSAEKLSLAAEDSFLPFVEHADLEHKTGTTAPPIHHETDKQQPIENPISRPLTSANNLWIEKPRRHLLSSFALITSLLLAGMGIGLWWQLQSRSGSAQPETTPPQPAAIASAERTESEASGAPTLPVPQAEIIGRPVPPPTSDKAIDTPDGIVKENQLHIERHAQVTATPPHIATAWQAYQLGDYANAEALYRQMLQSGRYNQDAVLGLAALALHSGKPQEAAIWYRQRLEENPQDHEARLGIMSVDPQRLPDTTVIGLQQAADAANSAELLGRYFAENERWHEAQEHFFNALSKRPDKADLTYNLAVCLEHLGETALAAGYYRKALSLDDKQFDRSQAVARLAKLGADQ